MPCTSDCHEVDVKQAYNQETARCYRYALLAAEQALPTSVLVASRDTYCNKDFTDQLCGFLRSLSPEAFERIVYARNKDARNLANWWEEHERMDNLRVQQELLQANKHRLQQQALAKLTPEERDALGYK
jgi:hypothetical protein